jgi:hypothetical protein
MAIEIKDVLFNDGEGLDYNDLNNIQRYERARFYDLFLGQMMRGTVGGSDVLSTCAARASIDATQLYAHGWGGAAKIFSNGAGGPNLQLKNFSGLIATYGGGALTGLAPQVLPYHLDNEEVNPTFAAADPTNPRWDLVQIKINAEAGGTSTTRDFQDAFTGALTSTSFNKRFGSSITWNVKTGTPAGSPTVPTPDAGFFRLWAVFIPAAFGSNPILIDTGSTLNCPRDYRLPMSLAQAPGSWVHTQAKDSFGAWTYNNTDDRPVATAGSQVQIWPCPVRGHGRLVRLHVYGQLTAGANRKIELIRLVRLTSGTTQVLLRDVSATSIVGSNMATNGGYVYFADVGDIPYWTSGYNSPYSSQVDQLAVRVTSQANTDTIHSVGWEIAS